MTKETKSIAEELEIELGQVKAVKSLLEDDNTIPFIARYRKEETGSLDEVQIGEIKDELERVKKLESRRDTIIGSLKEQEELTDELRKEIDQATSLSELEDIYLPYKPSRSTKGSKAKERGLEPLADIIQEQRPGLNPEVIAKSYVDEEKGVDDPEAALQGARDVIAENVNENKEVRQKMREFFFENGSIKSELKDSEADPDEKYREYYDLEEPALSAPSHRVLAIFRGENEDVLSVKVRPPKEEGIKKLKGLIITGNSRSSDQVKLAIEDCYKRLLAPSLETDLRNKVKEKADKEAVEVFEDNLEELLMSPPLGQKRVLGIDPGFKSGCKLAALDAQGKFLDYEAVFPHEPQNETDSATETISEFVSKYDPEAIAIGDGTASQETESFVRGLDLLGDITVVRVNEDGASVYSASEIGREEFPEQDVTVRGAISIGRRLQDPLSELVKIDPKSLGIGQYQHDVDQNLLENKLTEVVERCVNRVGVNVNTASEKLLTYVAGLGPTLAGNIVGYRTDNGQFTNIEQLKEVPRIGPKTFQQSAGFLRIVDGDNPLDNSGVHPEDYSVVEKMANDLECAITEMVNNSEIQEEINLENYVDSEVGLPTLTDILDELEKPGRDPRPEFEPFDFSDDINEISDLEEGLVIPGVVTNVTNFGAFVDIGLKSDGLIHISELSQDYVDHPRNVVKLNQRVRVKVLDVDKPRKRVSLSLNFEED
ncbi:RNA-binding transcriptional accessory protein [Candidatus Bipolaricaulota bacterium]|nr:RNA-binding transcriptional accessory protein [Candidatus Bipolaricaulota bacterium]